MSLKLLFFLLSYLTLQLCPAAALTIDIDSAFNHEFLSEGIEFLEDSRGSLSQEEVNQRSDWQNYHGRELNFGFSASSFWLRFHTTNKTAVEQYLILENQFPLIDRMDFYILQKNLPTVKIAMGDSLTAESRRLLHSHFLAQIKLMPQQSATVLIRVKSASGLQLPLVLWEQNAFIENNHAISMLLGLLYGLLLAMAIYHLLIFFSTREPSFFYYALVNISLLCNYLSLHGVASAYLWTNQANVIDRPVHVAISSAALFSVLFLQSILKIPQARPGLSRVLRWLTYLLAANIVISLVTISPWVVKVVLVSAGAAIILTTVALVVRLIDGYPPAKIIFIGGVCAATGFSVTLLGNLGVVASTPLTVMGAYVGITIMTMVQAFALSYRMNMDRQLRQDVQSQLIESQRQANQSLDQLVQERTEELEAANTRLQKISNTDALTQINNRRYFDATFEKEIKRAFREKAPLSVLLMDIDHFKMINDSYGHPFGDTCLKQAAEFIQSCIRRPPDFAARYGGEEFVVLLPHTDTAGAIHVANSIRQAFNSNKVEEGELKISISVSIGVACMMPGEQASASVLLKHVDALLYQAKANGRNRVESDLVSDN